MVKYTVGRHDTRGSDGYIISLPFSTDKIKDFDVNVHSRRLFSFGSIDSFGAT